MKVPSTVFFHFLNNSQRTREVPSWGSFSCGNHTSPGQCCYVLFCSPQSLAVACLQNTNWNHIAFEITLRALRLRVGEGRAKSLKQFQQRAVYQLAARMWSDGVSWDEALLISERAVQAEHQCRGKAKGKGKNKSKPGGKGHRKGGWQQHAGKSSCEKCLTGNDIFKFLALSKKQHICSLRQKQGFQIFRRCPKP